MISRLGVERRRRSGARRSRATASRNSARPRLDGYWCVPGSATASCIASTISGGRRAVGVADAEADHVDAGGLLGGDLALELGEQVRRDALQALTRSHAAPSSEVVGSSVAPRTRGRAQPVRFTCRSSPTSTSSSPPSSDARVTGELSPPRSDVRDRGAAWRRCRRTASPPPRARRSARGSRRAPIASTRRTRRRSCGSGTARCARSAGRSRQVERLELRASATAIAHCGLPIETCWKRHVAPAGAAARRARRRRPPGKSLELRLARPMSTRAGRRAGDRAGGSRPAAVWIEKLSASVQPRRRRYRIASRAPLPDSSASEPSGLKIRRSRDEARVARRRTAAARRRRTTPKWASHSIADARRRQLERQLVALDDQVVVAERLPLLESHRCRRSRGV